MQYHSAQAGEVGAMLLSTGMGLAEHRQGSQSQRCSAQAANQPPQLKVLTPVCDGGAPHRRGACKSWGQSAWV